MTSTYPNPEKLDESTARLAASLNKLESRISGRPLPVAVAAATLDLTDAMRLAVCREIRQSLGYMPTDLWAYEGDAMRRIGR